MTNIIKWTATVLLVFVVGSNAFDQVYNILYPWNILGGVTASLLLVYVSVVQKDKPYLMLNSIVALLYGVGFIQGVL